MAKRAYLAPDDDASAFKKLVQDGMAAADTCRTMPHETVRR